MQTSMLQGASSEVEEALDDKDEACEYVTALLDDTLEQADAAVDAAKRALQRGENPATSKVSSPRQHTNTPSTFSWCRTARCLLFAEEECCTTMPVHLFFSTLQN